MRIVLISDTHGKHEELGTLSGDVLIHCGDFCDGFKNDGAEISAIDRWFSMQQFERIFCIGGNHDFAAQERHEKGIPIFENAIFLQDEAYEFGGLTFYGTPWLPDLVRWSYYLPDDERREKWNLIPDSTDVLITHTPPFGILDKPRSGRSVGCPYLRDIVFRTAPKLHCFGHVHASTGQLVQGKTTFVNAAVTGQNFLGPVVIEID